MGMLHASNGRGILRSELVRRFSKTRRTAADVRDAEKETGWYDCRFDIFGSLPRDVQVDVLGYVAADRPVQVLLMRQVRLIHPGYVLSCACC